MWGMFDNEDDMKSSNSDNSADSFDGILFRKVFADCTYAEGLEKPSDIQKHAIMPCLGSSDAIIQAPSRTEMVEIISNLTIQKIDKSINKCQALILVPTPELAEQLKGELLVLGMDMELQYDACSGDDEIDEDLVTTVHGVLGTPGLVYNMIHQNMLGTELINLFVLYAADEMLSLGFKDQIWDVYKLCPNTVQVILLSLTLSAELVEKLNLFKLEPTIILKNEGELTVEGIKQVIDKHKCD